MNRNESNARVIHALFGKSSDGTNRLPEVAEGVVPREIARSEEEVPRVKAIIRIRRRRPVEAVRAGVEEVGAVAVAGSG